MRAQPIDAIEVVVVDVETTGLDPRRGDRICEIGAIKLRAGREVDRFHSLVNPDRPISPGAFAVNRITPDMVDAAPRAADVLPGFLTFSEGALLAAYNAKFDVGFLHAELDRAALPRPDAVVLDVLRLARRLLPRLPRHSLKVVVRRLGIADRQTHRALDDVELTSRVLLHFLADLKAHGAVTVADVLGRGAGGGS